MRRDARERYRLAAAAFGASGRLLHIDFAEAERLAAALRADGAGVAAVGDVTAGGATAGVSAASVTAGSVTAAVLLHELAHLLIAAHPLEAAAATAALVGLEPSGRADALLADFAEAFPPPPVVNGALAASEYVAESLEAAWEELLLLDLADRNPAYRPLQTLFDLGALRDDPRLVPVLTAIETTLGRPVGAPDAKASESAGAAGAVSLMDLLLAPQRQHPGSLADQLRAAIRIWAPLLKADLAGLLRDVDRALGVLAEEDRYLAHLASQEGRPDAPGYGGWGLLGAGPSAFSADREWMSRTVLVAKNAFVWLAQLSRAYGRTVSRLDEVPDQALDDLAADGMDALWLIGIWQRSRASKTIKRLRGQPEAEASAYAVDDYVVAPELGGEVALEDLRRRAAERGIRLACDMVPNHTGIDGRWVIEHPERFVQVASPPYAAYTFTGPDVSGDPRVEIRIEDGYYQGTDAAVVFERRDPASGERRYIFHGNDGTAMPWNDTAQIDFLDPPTREAVIQKVIEVCQTFSIVRFDAAMTLAKRHVRRLWHPRPGAHDGVPSRGRFAASDEEFEAAMPREFWREVVERAAREAPDTLLLAEAFWMLEGYFVRELGMHRVYNSAFMHMLADEDNGKYRAIVKETLGSDPRVLERFVNYLSNPDEESAAETFGKGAKALAATVLLATLPGLPLFAHGQVEGLSEKYGMEFRSPRLNERPDEWHRDQHRRVIAPLLARRRLFASALGFALYDATYGGDPPGRVAEDVYAFSNAQAGERALVVVNNAPDGARVRIDRGAKGLVPDAAGAGSLVATSLFAELIGDAGQTSDPWLVAHDVISGAGFARPVPEVASEGLVLDLGGYQALVLLDVRVQSGAPWEEGPPARVDGVEGGGPVSAARRLGTGGDARGYAPGPQTRAAAARRRRSRPRR